MIAPTKTLPFRYSTTSGWHSAHAEAPFATALYPLGRDATPYQGVFAAMRMFPGVAWFLDPVFHHLALGGIALMEDWAAYCDLLGRAYGPTGGAVAQTVASNWGTGALFRRYDLLEAVAAAQSRRMAAWPALAARLSPSPSGARIGVVPLGATWAGDIAVDVTSTAATDPASATSSRPGRASGAASPRGKIRQLAIMTVNDSYATTAVRVASALLEALDGVTVKLCISEPIYKAEGLRVAQHKGIEERIHWELTTSPERLERVAATSDVLVWLAEELQGGHRLLLLRSMAAGKVTVIPRCGLYDDLPDGAAVRIDLGSSAAPTVAALLEELLADPELLDRLRAAGRRFAAASPGIDVAARALESELAAGGRRGATTAGRARFRLHMGDDHRAHGRRGDPGRGLDVDRGACRRDSPKPGGLLEMSAFSLAFVVLMWLPGHLVLRLSGARKYAPRTWSTGERLFAEIALSGLLVLWVAVTLALLGLLTRGVLVGGVSVPTLALAIAVCVAPQVGIQHGWPFTEEAGRLFSPGRGASHGGGLDRCGVVALHTAFRASRRRSRPRGPT